MARKGHGGAIHNAGGGLCAIRCPAINPTKAPTMDTFFALLFLGTFVATIIAVARPKTFAKLLRTPSRWKQAAILGFVSFVCFVAFGITAPPPAVDTAVVTETKKEDVVAIDTATPVIDQPSVATSATSTATQSYTVTNVVDGDTIDVSINGEVKRLRLIGVDTPETKDPRKTVQCFGKEASAFTTSTLLNQSVTLEADDSQGDLDKYGRELRYVILSDGTNFNKLLIHDGYAHEYTYHTAYKYQVEFKAAQADAESSKRGLWADDTCAGNTTTATESSTSTPTATGSVAETTTSPDSTATDTTTTTQETAPTTAPTAVCDCASDTYNCGDFSTHTAAQTCFDYCIDQTGKDIHRLDGNNDGSACE